MRIVVISDTHIESDSDPIYKSCIWLIKEFLQPGDLLVLNGDLFDLFLGDHLVFKKQYAELLDALRAKTDVKIDYIEGNHDFHLGRLFREFPHVTVHDSSLGFTQGGKNFYFEHGDLVNVADKKYLLWRKFTRDKVVQKVISGIPGTLLKSIGHLASSLSSGMNPIDEAAQSRMRKIFHDAAAEKVKQGFDFIVMGHCHDLDEKEITSEGRRGQYINMGYPKTHKSFLVYDEKNGKFVRHNLPIGD